MGVMLQFQMALVYTISTESEVCPSNTNAIGASLGWVGIMEVPATLLFAGLLILVGVAKPVTPQASFWNLLR